MYACDKGRRGYRRNYSSVSSSPLPSQVYQKYNIGLNNLCVGRAGSMVSVYPFAKGSMVSFWMWFDQLAGNATLRIGQADLAGQERFLGVSRMEGKLNWDLAFSQAQGASSERCLVSPRDSWRQGLARSEEESMSQCVSGSWFTGGAGLLRSVNCIY